MPSSEERTVGWMSRCMCMIREQRHMEGVARMGPVSPPPVAWPPCGLDWSPASNVSASYCTTLEPPPPIHTHFTRGKRILYLAAVTPLLLLHAAPATPQHHNITLHQNQRSAPVWCCIHLQGQSVSQAYSKQLNMEETCFTKTSVTLYQTEQRHIVSSWSLLRKPHIHSSDRSFVFVGTQMYQDFSTSRTERSDFQLLYVGHTSAVMTLNIKPKLHNAVYLAIGSGSCTNWEECGVRSVVSRGVPCMGHSSKKETYSIMNVCVCVCVCTYIYFASATPNSIKMHQVRTEPYHMDRQMMLQRNPHLMSSI
jgi:hypothetical protein